MGKRRLPEVVPVIIVVLLLILLTVPSAVAGDTAQTLPGVAGGAEPLSEHFGVVASHLMLNDTQSIERQLDAMAEAGIKWVRCTFAWPDLERKQGVWDFSKMDYLVEKAAEHGVKILGILGGCPPWANGGKEYAYPPTDMVAWRGYVSGVCARYRGRIAAWEIWNEENIPMFWQPTPNPQDYVRVLGNASDEIRKADPGAKVIMGGVAGLGQKYLNDCLAAGAANYIDAIAYHPYFSEVWGGWFPFDVRPNEACCRQVLQEMKAMISRYTSKHLELWLTELGWNTGGWYGTVDYQTQAAYTLRTLINYASEGVDKVFYYSLWDEYPWVWWPEHFGLLQNDFTPKDAFSYYKTFEQFFGKATSTAPDAVLSTSCSKPANLEVHSFRAPDESLMVAAWESDDLDDALSLKVKGSALEDPLRVNPSTLEAASTVGFSRDSNEDITVSNLTVGKVPVILTFAPRMGAVTGKVQANDGGAVAGCQVGIYDSVTGGLVCNTVTDKGGDYSIAGVPEGSYKVQFCEPHGRFASEWYRDTVRPELAQKVEVKGGGLTRVDAQLESPGSTWYLAEGTSDYGFESYITIENPNTSPVTAMVTYMTKTGSRTRPDLSLPAMSQTVINPRDDIGATDFSTRVECKEGKTIAADRRMIWTGPGALSSEGHSSVGVTSPAGTWYMAEGSSKWGFETWLLIQNPNPADASCKLTYMIEGVGPRSFTKTVKANTRASFFMADDIGAADASIKLESNVPVIPERSMYRNNRREGHNSTGAASPASDYYLAEGTTDWGFTTYVLIQNPNDQPNTVTLTYMTPQGPVPQAPFSIPANSRRTVKVNDALPAHDLSTHVQGTLPLIAERAMYWTSPTGEACHDSIGMDSPHTTFYLPDGETGGSSGMETWTLVQNPNPSDVRIQVSYLRPGGTGNVSFTDTVKANSRNSYNMGAKITAGQAAVLVTSKNPGQGIMVERAMYWNSRGAGTDTIGGYSD